MVRASGVTAPRGFFIRPPYFTKFVYLCIPLRGIFCCCILRKPVGKRPERWHVDDIDIGERLRLARVEAGLTMRKAETVSGVNKDTISRIEKGRKRGPNPLTVAKLARAYGRKPEEFLYPKGVIAFWEARTPEEILEQTAAASRWSVMPDEEWAAVLENADADEAKELYEALEEERQATFAIRQVLRSSKDVESKNAAARLGFRFLSRQSQLFLKVRDKRLIEELERIGTEALASGEGL